MHAHQGHPLLVRCDVQLRDTITEAADGSRSFLLRVALGLAALIGVVSFMSISGSSRTDPGSTTTGASTTSPIGVADLAPSTSSPDASPLAVVATLAPEAIPVVGLRTPQAAARNLWDAWRDRDRPRALLYAAPEAVDNLMEWTWIPQVRQAGCTPLETVWLCRFEGPKHRWDASIVGDAEVGYRVRTLRVGEPAGDLLAPAELPSVTNTVPTVTNPDGSTAQLGPSLPVGASLPSTVASDSSVPSGQSDPSAGNLSSSIAKSNKNDSPSQGLPQSTKRSRAATSRAKRPSTTKSTGSRDQVEAPATQTKKAEPTPPRQSPVTDQPTSGPVPVQGGTTPVPLEP